MSNTSYSFKENSHMKVIQGGEKKVMKKILSVALSTAMAFSMFASVAFGADAKLSPEQQFNVLKDAGIVTGYPDGTAGLDKSITRAELAKVIVKSINLEPITGVATYKDKNYTASHWAAPFIEAATQAGILEGKNLEKKLFDPTGNVTVQELAKVLVAALKLEVPAETNNTATEWAKGYVEAAVKAGYLEAGINYQANATRAQAVVAAHAIYEVNNFKVVKAEASDATHVKLTLSTGEVVDVVLEKALEANKATELTYKAADGRELKYTVTYVVTTATKVEKVSASNLREIVVAFDGKVDKGTAEEEANYTLKSGKIVSSAVLSDDEKTVTLTLSNTLVNNKVDYLTVGGVKAGDATISAKQVEFLTTDNVLPEVTSVQSLGTKAVKVVFSEPVVGLSQDNFELDGKAFYGKLSVRSTDYTRTVILTPYNSSALIVGDHKLVVKGVKDAASFVSLTSTHEIKVAEDKEAPTVAEATATLEAVTLTFSEDVDAETVTNSNVYWKSGTAKKTGTVTKIADNKYKVKFTGVNNELPSGAVTIYVDNVADYSGNKIASGTTVVVNPTIDQTRPEVKKVTTNGAKSIQVTFNKDINNDSAKVRGNYTVLDKDGKVISVLNASASGSVVTINLYSELSAGNNSLTIKNLQDDTRLKNTMLDYSGTVNLADSGAPTIDSRLVNTSTRTVIIGFSEAMDYETLANYSNYHVVINGTTVPLTSEMADISPLQDSNAVAIKFVENYGNLPLYLAPGDGGSVSKNVTRINVLGVKDAAGNLLKEFTESTTNFVVTTGNLNGDLGVYDTVSGVEYQAALTGDKTIKVKFNAGIKDFTSLNAFKVTKDGNAVGIDSIDVNGTSTVVINLSKSVGDSIDNLTVAVDKSKLLTLAGQVDTNVAYTAVTGVLDKVAPVLKLNAIDELTATAATYQIKVDFSENVKLVAGASETLLAKDFKIVRSSDRTELKAGVDFTIANNSVDGSKAYVTIQLADEAKVDTTYLVTFLGSSILVDLSPAANAAPAADPAETNVLPAHKLN